MPAPILSNNISSKMEIAEVVEPFFIEPNNQIRYRIRMFQTLYNAIPIINNTVVYKPGDKVIVMFKNSQIEDTPFIVGKFNQVSPEESLLISSIPPIKKPEDRQAIKYETDYSVFQMDSKRKRITIGNKDSAGEIVIDNNEVIIGGVNLSTMIKDLSQTITNRLNDKIINSNRSIYFEVENGESTTKAKEINFFSSNFMIRNKSEMMIDTNHLNFISSFVEFNVITPKTYNVAEQRAFSFFAVDGDYEIALGKGDYKASVQLPISYMEMLVAPLTPFSGSESSFSGLSLGPIGVDLSYLYGANKLEIGPNYYTLTLLGGSAFFESFSAVGGIYTMALLGGTASMTLMPSGFFITIAGNTLSFTPAGLTISSGMITTLAGDVQAMGGTYSLMRHMHPTAIPGGPSMPLPL